VFGAVAALLTLSAGACTPGGSEESAVRRGDEAFARDSLEEALAEYRLAVNQGAQEPEVLSRVAHTFIAMGRVEEATEFYVRAAARDPRWGDLGAADLVRLARAAADREDLFQMAAASEAARKLRPGLSVPDLTLPLGRHYLRVGDYGRAIPLYQRALDEAERTSPDLVFEVGEAHREVDDCRSALIFFDRYRELATESQRPLANYNIGDCSLRLARSAQARGNDPDDLQEALQYLNRSLEVGEPRGIQGQVWYEKGEVLSRMLDCDGALDAFDQVRFYESGSAPIVNRAQERIDQIRIGRGLAQLRGRCG
jgi:tetratricopeptide (TPR) repeat protein